MKISVRTIVTLCTLFAFVTSCQLRFAFEPKKDAKPIKVSNEIKALGTYNRHRSCYDVLHYAIEIEPNPIDKTISGTVIFTCKLDSVSDTLQFDMHKNLNIKGIYFENETKPLRFFRKYRAVKFSIANKNIKQGDVFNFKVVYEGKPMRASKPPWKGGAVWSRDKDKKPWLGVACESQGASIWMPCKDHNLDEADSISMSIICTDNLVGVSNGKFNSVDSLDNKKLRYNWSTSYPINNYNITYYVGDFIEIKDTLQAKRGVVNVSYFVLPQNRLKAETHFKQVHDVFHFYETTFGPYSWVKDGFKLVESPYEGMGHQTAIAYGGSYKNTDHIHADYIVLHETAHEWWGNSVSATDFAHIWIHEGLATYAEALYAEHVGGTDSYLNKLRTDRLFIQNKRPIVGPENLMYFNYKESDFYSKGALVLHTLRSVIDDDILFFDIIQTFYKENEQSLVNTNDFIKLVNKKTGADYHWFFNQYLLSRHVPNLDFYIAFDGYIYYRWVNCNKDFDMEITVYIDNVKYNLKPTTELQRAEIHKTGNIHSYMFDSYSKYYRSHKDSEELVIEFVTAHESELEFGN